MEIDFVRRGGKQGGAPHASRRSQNDCFPFAFCGTRCHRDRFNEQSLTPKCHEYYFFRCPSSMRPKRATSVEIEFGRLCDIDGLPGYYHLMMHTTRDARRIILNTYTSTKSGANNVFIIRCYRTNRPQYCIVLIYCPRNAHTRLLESETKSPRAVYDVRVLELAREIKSV